jgi:dihydroflavonol-4-reductase
MSLAKFFAPAAEWYYKIAGKRPRFTRYSLETVVSNSEIQSEKARRELAYQPRTLAQSIADTIRWWMDNYSLTRSGLRL